MLIGTIVGPTITKAKEQIKMANKLCDGAELRLDLFHEFDAELIDLIEGISILKTLSPTKFKADYIDIPWNLAENPVNAKVIRSYHNFEETPEDLQAILGRIPSADLYKVACMAHSTCDALRMVEFVKSKQNVIGISMGEFGQISRILSPILGNPFNYVEIGEKAAPGQMSANELLEIYNYDFLNRETKIYGLIGNPISQSPSHKTHNAFFKKNNLNAVYLKMEVLDDELRLFFSLAKKVGISGLSVTMPHKEAVILFLDEIDPEAMKIGAVNTLKFEEGKIFGTNTDAKGGLDSIEEKTPVHGKKMVILGRGGASKAICYEAKKRGAEVFIWHRGIQTVPPHDILVNATPSPMPIDGKYLIPKTVVMDINHKKSPLLERAEGLNCEIVLGFEMFQRQAALQFDLWLTNARCCSNFHN